MISGGSVSRVNNPPGIVEGELDPANKAGFFVYKINRFTGIRKRPLSF